MTAFDRHHYAVGEQRIVCPQCGDGNMNRYFYIIWDFHPSTPCRFLPAHSL